MKPGAEGWKDERSQDIEEKITEMDWATSFSLASITGAVAAMAEPPQIEEPTPNQGSQFCIQGKEALEEVGNNQSY